jgi:hypothetical protein
VTVDSGSEIVRRPCFVFGGLKRRPTFVCSRDRATVIFAGQIAKNFNINPAHRQEQFLRLAPAMATTTCNRQSCATTSCA